MGGQPPPLAPEEKTTCPPPSWALYRGAETSNIDNSPTVPKMAGSLEHLVSPKDSPCQSLGFLG